MIELYTIFGKIILSGSLTTLLLYFLCLGLGGRKAPSWSILLLVVSVGITVLVAVVGLYLRIWFGA